MTELLRRATACYGDDVETVSHREMRNNSAELLRRVAAGEEVTITNNGVPVAVMLPVTMSRRDQLIASGRLIPGSGLDLDALPAPVRSKRSSESILEELRGE